jgi:hypothetical protein
MARVIIAAMALAAAGMLAANGAASAATGLPMPRSDGALEVSDHIEYGESFPFHKVRFTGDIRFMGEAPDGFVLHADARDGAAAVFVHRIVPHARIRLWLYRVPDSALFSAEHWNARLQAIAEAAGGEVRFSVDQPFHDGRNSGPVVLGHVSMDAQLRVTGKAEGEDPRHRLVVTRAPDGRWLLVASLSAEAPRFGHLNTLFEAFVRSLYLPD